MPTISVIYKGEVVKTIDSNKPDTIDLLTGGKYCEGDIEIQYVNHCPKENPVASFSMDDFYNMYQPTTSIVTFSLTNPLTASETDYSYGYVASTGTWYYSASTTNNRADIYQVEANKTYLIKLGSTVSNRFRVMFTTEDVTQATSNVDGISILANDSPSANASTVYTTPGNGYIIIGKSTDGTNNIETFVYEGDV